MEMHFYMKCGKSDLSKYDIISLHVQFLNLDILSSVDDFVKQKKLPYLNLPVFHGSGSHEVQGTKHRFVVTNKFGRDLWSIFQTNKKFPFGTVLSIAKQTVTYIHSLVEYKSNEPFAL